MAAAKVLRTDVHLTPPEGGYPEVFKAGTKASDLPDWVSDAKATDALGRPTDQPLLGDHVWRTADDDLEERPVAGPGETDGFDIGYSEPVGSDDDETVNTINPDKPEPRKTTRRG